MDKTYRIAGMHCGSCAFKIEKGVKKVKGARKANVNFKTKTLDVTGSFDEKEVKKAVSSAGDYRLLKESEQERIRIGTKLKITFIAFMIVFLVSFIPMLAPLNEAIITYVKLIWWAILLGLLIGGLIDYFVPEDFIFKYLGQKKKSTLFFAVLAGFLLSACSHGILAISIQLYKKGASIPAVMTFLLASPWANLPVTILLFSFFGWKALLFIGSAMIIALFAGFVFAGLEKIGWIEKSKIIKLKDKIKWDKISHFNLKESIYGVTKGTVSLANMVLWWILLGFMIAAVIRAYVPDHLFMQYLGPSFLGLVGTLVFATILEVCSEGSAPVAFEIYSKVGTLGNPFVFLMAGVVTDYTEIGLIWTNIGRKTAIWLPIITVPVVLLVGYLFNLFL